MSFGQKYLVVILSVVLSFACLGKRLHEDLLRDLEATSELPVQIEASRNQGGILFQNT